MPFYTGKSADGSDMQEVQGLYVSPNELFWGNTPISLEEERKMYYDYHTLPKTRRERRRIERIKLKK